MFSIVIPAKNEEKEIGTLLQSIRDQTIQPEKLIVADKSTDNTRKIAESFGAIVVDGVDDGYVGKARNNGAANSTSDLLFFIDADIELPTTTFCEDVATCMTSLDLDVTSCYYKPATKEFITKLIFFGMNVGKRFDSIFKFGFASGGGFTGVKKSVFDDIGGFKETIKTSEDLEFTTRAVRKGYSFGMLPLNVIVSTRRFTNRPFKATLTSVLGGFGTMAASVFRISAFEKYTKKFDDWYGKTGGDVDFD